MDGTLSIFNTGPQWTSEKHIQNFKCLFPAGSINHQKVGAAGLGSRDNNKYSVQAGVFHWKSVEARELLQKNISENAPKLRMCAGNKCRSTNMSFDLSVRKLALAFCFGGVAGFVRILLSVLPPDFWDRWHKLVREQPQNGDNNRTDSNAGTIIYDCHGTVIATIVPPTGSVSTGKHDRPGRRPLRASDIPSYMWQAVVASEDRRFFEHHGIDPKGVARAALSMSAGGGGSTITQQIYWGHGMYGIETASAFYFGKHPSLLTLGECAMLAGIIPAPEFLSPYRDTSRGKKPQARTLRRMVEAGFLDVETAASAVNEPLVLGSDGREGASGPWRAPYFVSEVLYELTQKYGRDAILRDGLQVYTTLDLERQEMAEKVIREGAIEYDKERLTLAEQGLQKAYENMEILYKAREEEIDKTVARAVARLHVELKRSTKNSTFIAEHDKISREALISEAVAAASEKARANVMQKYLTATRDHILVDEPCTFCGFSPENYDRKFRGRVTPFQLATVYSTIASGGFYCRPYLIRRVETGDGRVLEEQSNSGKENAVVDEYAVSEVRQLLQAVVERGTGCAARLGRPCAGKTGTSDGHRDVWFAGFTPELSCVVWFGYDDNAIVGGLHPATGASHAAPIWQQFMENIHKGLPINKFHDIGSDKYGMRAPRQFQRKSRRTYRMGLPMVGSRAGSGTVGVGGRVSESPRVKDVTLSSQAGGAAKSSLDPTGDPFDPGVASWTS